MRISFIGSFNRMHDEEYIAQSFEALGHVVQRIPEHRMLSTIKEDIEDFKPDVVLYCKFKNGGDMVSFMRDLRTYCSFNKIKLVCWVFDLYIGYVRETQLSLPQFKVPYVVTTDGGHNEAFKKRGINHFCVRQGIYEPECLLLPPDNPSGIVFVGSDNRAFSERTNMIYQIRDEYKNFEWIGRNLETSLRGLELNRLYSRKKIVIGDSVYSPYYWSNRIVETLGRGGFLIHREVPGIKEEYPDLVTYNGRYEDLKSKIDYYLTHEEERLEIVRKNFNHVLNNHLMKIKCKQLLDYIS